MERVLASNAKSNAKETTKGPRSAWYWGLGWPLPGRRSWAANRAWTRAWTLGMEEAGVGWSCAVPVPVPVQVSVPVHVPVPVPVPVPV